MIKNPIHIPGYNAFIAMRFIPDDRIVVEHCYGQYPKLAYVLAKKEREVYVIPHMDIPEADALDLRLPTDYVNEFNKTIAAIKTNHPVENAINFFYNFIPDSPDYDFISLNTERPDKIPQRSFAFYYTSYWVVMNYPVPKGRINPVKPDMSAYPSLDIAIKFLEHAEGLDVSGDLFADMAGSKELGAFFTPVDVAKRVVQRFYRKGMRVLEPSCGTGSFLIAMKDASVTAVEIDGQLAKAAEINFRLNTGKKIKVINDNFLNAQLNPGYDLIIGNPPWVPLRVYGPDVSDAMKALGYRTSTANVPNTDVSVLFVQKSLKLLNKKGKIVFIMPKNAQSSVIYGYMRRAADCNFIPLDYDGFPVESVVMVVQRRNNSMRKLDDKPRPYYYNIGRLGADIAREPFTIIKDENHVHFAAVHVDKDYSVSLVPVYLPLKILNGRYVFLSEFDEDLRSVADYFGKLTSPYQRAKYKVVYNANGNRVQAAIITDPNIIIASSLVYIPCRSMSEAEYLCDKLNSDEVNEFVDSIRESSRGHISKRALLYPIPKYGSIKLEDYI